MTVMLVEDDGGIIRNLSLLLEQEGFCVIAKTSQREAIDALKNGVRCDLALVDLGLPDGSGYAVCAAAKRMNTPVIFLTGIDDEASVVAGLDMGADDYITKPFRPLELVSRIKNVLRRSGKSQSIFELDQLKIDTVKATVYKNGQEIFLSALEYRLLLVFLNNKGTVLSRAKLLENIWDIAGDFVNDNTLTVYIKRLREKIEDDPQNPSIIKTVRGFGYKVGD